MPEIAQDSDGRGPARTADAHAGFLRLGKLGYRVDEFTLAGTATSYKLTLPPSADGRWTVVPDAEAPYKTRVVVVAPRIPRNSMASFWSNGSM